MNRNTDEKRVNWVMILGGNTDEEKERKSKKDLMRNSRSTGVDG